MTADSESPEPRCGACPIRKANERLCQTPDGKHPPECPTANKKELTAATLELYKAEPDQAIARASALSERESFSPNPDNGVLQARHPRLVETVNFARHLGCKKLGLIFCFGLREEAAIVNEVLETNGFTVVSSICKVGNVPKSAIGLKPEDQLNSRGPETMCNPIMQAGIMNEAGVDLNILFGLCVGHDTLALRHLKAPCTVLAVKDRASGHNPLACIYTYNTYSGYLKKPLFSGK